MALPPRNRWNRGKAWPTTGAAITRAKGQRPVSRTWAAPSTGRNPFSSSQTRARTPMVRPARAKQLKTPGFLSAAPSVISTPRRHRGRR